VTSGGQSTRGEVTVVVGPAPGGNLGETSNGTVGTTTTTPSPPPAPPVNVQEQTSTGTVACH